MGIDLPRDIGTRRLPWSRLRRIIENLPESSATARARRGQAPTIELLLLRRLEHTARLLYWSKTTDAEKGKNQPEPLVLTVAEAKAGKRDTAGLDQKLAARQAKRQAELAQLG